MFRIGGQKTSVIKMYKDPVIPVDDYEASVEPDNKEAHIIVRIASVGLSTAGVYTCDENGKQSAQFIVISKYFHSCEYTV